MTDGPRILYRPREDATPERELEALVSVYSYDLKTQGSKRAADHAPTPNGRHDHQESISQERRPT